MAFDFKFWYDAGMTTEFNPATDTLEFTDGGSAEDKVLYFGSTDTTKKCQAVGGGNIVLTPTDANSPADVHSETEIKLATTSGGLASATGGAPLSIAPLAGGAAQAVYVRATDATGGGVPSVQISIESNNLEQVAV